MIIFADFVKMMRTFSSLSFTWLLLTKPPAKMSTSNLSMVAVM